MCLIVAAVAASLTTPTLQALLDESPLFGCDLSVRSLRKLQEE